MTGEQWNFANWAMKFGRFFHSILSDGAFLVHCTALFCCFAVIFHDIIILLICTTWLIAAQLRVNVGVFTMVWNVHRAVILLLSYFFVWLRMIHKICFQAHIIIVVILSSCHLVQCIWLLITWKTAPLLTFWHYFHLLLAYSIIDTAMRSYNYEFLYLHKLLT